MKIFYLILFLISAFFLFSNEYIDIIDSIINRPITDGYIDASLNTVLERNYKKLLPFQLNDFSIFAELKGFINYSGNIEDFINNALAFSKMKNLYYLDPNINKNVLMVKETYTVDKDKFKNIEDRKYNDFIKDNNFYIMEHDAKTGKIILKGKINFISENEFTIAFTNISAVKFIVKLVDVGDYNIFYHFIKYNKGYFVYNAIKVKSKNKLLVWLIKKPEDFENRLLAFYGLLKKQLD